MSKNQASEDYDVVRAVFEHRLRQTDIDMILEQLSSSEKSELLDKFAGILERTSALIDIYNQVADALSLDTLLPRLIQVITEALRADRSTLFLHDPDTNTLFSRVAQGDTTGEIRFPANMGIAGAVFSSGKAEIIHDAYADSRFNQDVDKKTGYRTRNILCAPIRNKTRQLIGVTQVLNKELGDFDEDDQRFLEALTTQAASALENAKLFESIQKARREEARLLEVTSAISSELQLDTLLIRIIAVTTELLEADRSTLFLYDKKTNELWSQIAEGLERKEIRIPSHAGIAGSCFTSGEVLNIPDAYADSRFNQEVDRKTGYRTRNILCMPIRNKNGDRLGVIQVLNRRGGPFNETDEMRLSAFSAQAAIALENAQLFETVVTERNYTESILQSLSNGVMSLDADRTIIRVNGAAARILGDEAISFEGLRADNLFAGANDWILQRLQHVWETGEADITMDTDYNRPKGDTVSVNLTTVPLKNDEGEWLGNLMILEDISNEKRVKSTMARYMPQEIVDQVMAEEDSMLGGKSQDVSILFTDIRRFTTISEELGARDTVALLNDYFTLMADIVFNHHGILDKYIGDAIMALFGSPFPSDRDADHAALVARDMMRVMQRFNEEREEQNKLPLEIGLGIATGPVVTGNIGSPKRMDYTAIGDPVNLASRLEGANKVYGTKTLICETTKNNLKSEFILREMDLIRVKGKLQPVTIFQLMDAESQKDIDRQLKIAERFGTALKTYRSRNWIKAMEQFSDVLTLDPDDKPATLYLGRCTHYHQKPPPDEWDGVFEMTSK